jgi:hypothetical protein
LGYQQAGTGDSLDQPGRICLGKHRRVSRGHPKRSKGNALRWLSYLRHNERHPAKVYAVVNDHYILATPEQIKNAKVEKIEIGVAYAFAYSSQEFGKLKNTNPALHGIIKVIRDDVADYCSNRLGDLKTSLQAHTGKAQRQHHNTHHIRFRRIDDQVIRCANEIGER